MLLFTGIWIGTKSGYYSARTEYHTDRYSTDTDKAVKNCFAEGVASSPATQECVKEAIAADRESKRAEDDLEAQRQMADWAWALLIISVIQVPIGAVGLIALFITIRQGRHAIRKATEANEISQKVADADIRPYVFVEKVNAIEVKDDSEEWTDDDGELRREDGYYSARIEIILKNVGKVPARKMRISMVETYIFFNKTQVMSIDSANYNVPICAPSQSRRIYGAIYIDARDRREFDNANIGFMARLRFTFEDETGRSFSERAAFFMFGHEPGMFYIPNPEELLERWRFARRKKSRDNEAQGDLF